MPASALPLASFDWTRAIFPIKFHPSRGKIEGDTINCLCRGNEVNFASVGSTSNSSRLLKWGMRRERRGLRRFYKVWSMYQSRYILSAITFVKMQGESSSLIIKRSCSKIIKKIVRLLHISLFACALGYAIPLHPTSTQMVKPRLLIIWVKFGHHCLHSSPPSLVFSSKAPERL